MRRGKQSNHHAWRVTRRRPIEEDEDPATGLVNLFDVWLVFAISLLLAFLTIETRRSTSPQAQAGGVQAGCPIDSFRASGGKATGEGQKLGTAYKLKSGKIVYVPE